MTAAVLDRGRSAAPWRVTLRGPVPATLLYLLVTAVLATGVLPVVRQTQGNPLAAGLIAFGVGWLVSSLLPASEKEKQLAQQAESAVKEHKDALLEPAKQAAQEIGDQLKPAAQDAVESVKSTAQDAAATVKSEGQSAAQDVQGQ